MNTGIDATHEYINRNNRVTPAEKYNPIILMGNNNVIGQTRVADATSIMVLPRVGGPSVFTDNIGNMAVHQQGKNGYTVTIPHTNKDHIIIR